MAPNWRCSMCHCTGTEQNSRALGEKADWWHTEQGVPAAGGEGQDAAGLVLRCLPQSWREVEGGAPASVVHGIYSSLHVFSPHQKACVYFTCFVSDTIRGGTTHGGPQTKRDLRCWTSGLNMSQTGTRVWVFPLHLKKMADKCFSSPPWFLRWDRYLDLWQIL